MSGIRIKFDETTGEFFAEPIPRRVRDHKGKSILEFPESYTVIDIETTGLDPMFDSIIELGAIKFENGNQISQFQSLVNPGYEIGDCIIHPTGSANDMHSEAATIQGALPNFQSVVRTSILVGYNINFDSSFI